MAVSLGIRPALKNKPMAVVPMAFRARNVTGAFEKWARGPWQPIKPVISNEGLRMYKDFVVRQTLGYELVRANQASLP